MAGYTLRIGTASDAACIAEAYARESGLSLAVLRDELECAFHSDPGPASLMALDAKGRLVAHLGALRLPMLRDGKPLIFGRAFASFVEGSFRIGGRHSPFMELQARFREHFEGRDGIALFFGWWQEIDHWFLRALAGFEPISTGWLLERPAGHPPERTELRFSELALADLEQGQDRGVGTSIRRVRDREWLRQHLELGRRGLGVFDGGVPLALAVVSDSESERRLLDLAVADGDPSAADAIMAAVIGDGLRPVRGRIWNPDRWSSYLLQNAGFQVRVGDEVYLSARWSQRGLKQSILHEHWQLMEGDFGSQGLPQFSVGEAIVSPPMAGTEARKPRRPAGE